MVEERNVEEFDRDVVDRGGYLYTTDRLSCRLANRRMSDAVHAAVDVSGKRVLDVGCGAVSYTHLTPPTIQSV